MMLTLNPKDAALAALVTAGLAGLAAATLVPPSAHAQDYDNGYRDREDTRTDRNRDITYRYHRYHSSAHHRDWIGIGTPGHGVGFYTNSYHHYCGHWDPTYGYCYIF